jgi:hypothetical protein
LCLPSRVAASHNARSGDPPGRSSERADARYRRLYRYSLLYSFSGNLTEIDPVP